MDEQREAENHRLVGGELCLDFANTLNGHARIPHHEYLHDYRDTVLWGRHAGVLPPDEAGTLLREAARRPAEAQTVYCQGLELRETIFRIFACLAGGRPAARKRPGAPERRLAGRPGPRPPGGFLRRLQPGLGRRTLPRATAAGGCRFRHPSAGLATGPPGQELRRRELRLAVRRYQSQPLAALVFDGRVRQPRQNAAPPGQAKAHWCSHIIF